MILSFLTSLSLIRKQVEDIKHTHLLKIRSDMMQILDENVHEVFA